MRTVRVVRRPIRHQPAPHPNNAAAAVVSLHKMETARYADFSISMASSTLNTALLTSVGEKNRNHLKTTFPALKLYMLSPRDIVDTMRAKHGVWESRPPFKETIETMSVRLI